MLRFHRCARTREKILKLFVVEERFMHLVKSPSNYFLFVLYLKCLFLVHMIFSLRSLFFVLFLLPGWFIYKLKYSHEREDLAFCIHCNISNKSLCWFLKLLCIDYRIGWTVVIKILL